MSRIFQRKDIMSGAAHSGVNKDKNYYCFACAIGGDVIDYVS